MPSLCDVNVLLALAAKPHEFHVLARTWFDSLDVGEAVVCRVAMLGLLRLCGNPHAMAGNPLSPETTWRLWSVLSADERITIALEEPAELDSTLENLCSERGYRKDLWTDAYLAAFAISDWLKLVTFDRNFQQFPGLDCLVLAPA